MSILIQSSFDTAINEIPEMILPQRLISINGNINNISIKILIDTGATTSIIFKHSTNRLNLNYLIDQEERVASVHKQNVPLNYLEDLDYDYISLR